MQRRMPPPRDEDLGVEGLSEPQMWARYRSALDADDMTLAADTAYLLTTRWMDQKRYTEVEMVCREMLEHVEDARLLHGLARAEDWTGRRAEALEHYEQAVACSPELTPTSAKSLVIDRVALHHNLALLLIRDDGEPTASAVAVSPEPETDRAMELWEDALRFLEGLEDEEEQRRTLIGHVFGWMSVRASPGRAAELQRRFAGVLGKVGDLAGQAGILHNIALGQEREGDFEGACENLESARLCAETGQWENLVTVLGNTASAEEGSLSHLAQAYWYALEKDLPIEQLTRRARDLIEALGRDRRESMRIALVTDLIVMARKRRQEKDLASQDDSERPDDSQGGGLEKIRAYIKKTIDELVDSWITESSPN